MSYTDPNIITLGSLDYVITDSIMREPAQEFAVGLRMGAPQYDAREGCYYRVFSDFRGGMGIFSGDLREHPDRWWEARDVRTWDSEQNITLAPLLTEITLGSIVPSASAGLSPGGAWQVAPDAAGAYTLFGAMGNRVFSTTSPTAPTFTNITPGSGPASAQTFTLLYHVDPTNLSDRGLFWGTGAAAAIWKRDLVAGTWSQPNASYFSDSLIEFDRKLISVFAGQISMSADGGSTWTDLLKVQSDANFAPFWAGVGQDSFGQLMPYLVSSGRLYAIDIWTRQAVPIELGLPSSVVAAIVWQDGEVVASDGYFVKTYHPSRPVRNIGFDRDGGVFVNALIRDFSIIAGRFLVAHVDIGTTLLNLFIWDGGGWHVLVGADAIFGPFGVWSNPGRRSMMTYQGTTVYNPANELFLMAYQTGSRPRIFHMSTDGLKNPQLNPAHQYAGSVDGFVTTPWDDGGFSEMCGTAIEVEVFGVEYGGSLEIRYQINNDKTSTWTSLGTVTTSGVTKLKFNSGQGIAFKNIRFQILFKRPATDTMYYAMRSMVFKYLKVPAIRSRFSFTIDTVRTAQLRGTTEKAVIETLYAQIDNTPLHPFYYTDDEVSSSSPFWVRYVQLPRVDKQWQDGSTMTSVMRVTVEEPVASQSDCS